MASGFGYNGGRGRCFPFWQEFQKCYAQADTPGECVLQRDDYMECLHHTKEIVRLSMIKTEELKQAEKRAKLDAESRKRYEAAAKSGVMRTGLVEDADSNPQSAPRAA